MAELGWSPIFRGPLELDALPVAAHAHTCTLRLQNPPGFMGPCDCHQLFRWPLRLIAKSIETFPYGLLEGPLRYLVRDRCIQLGVYWLVSPAPSRVWVDPAAHAVFARLEEAQTPLALARTGARIPRSGSRPRSSSEGRAP